MSGGHEHDTGPDLGLKVGDCHTLADVDEAIMRLTARRIWLHSVGRDNDDTGVLRVGERVSGSAADA